MTGLSSSPACSPPSPSLSLSLSRSWNSVDSSARARRDLLAHCFHANSVYSPSWISKGMQCRHCRAYTHAYTLSHTEGSARESAARTHILPVVQFASHLYSLRTNTHAPALVYICEGETIYVSTVPPLCLVPFSGRKGNTFPSSRRENRVLSGN